MMNEDNTYYSLRLKGGFVNHHNGDVLLNRDEVLTIGEAADCDVRYKTQQANFTPEYYASILPDKSGEGWVLVKRAPNIDVRIAGSGSIGYAARLKNGDAISFGTQKGELIFRTHTSNQQAPTQILLKRKSHIGWLYASMLLLLAAVACSNMWIYFHRAKELNSEEVLNALQGSIYMLKVDEVEWLQRTEARDSLIGRQTFEGEQKHFGTAFLTKDSLLVTARHCVEYWLGEPIDLNMRIDNLNDDHIVRWAALAETFNHTHQTDSVRQLLRVHCSVYPHNATNATPVFTFTSTADSVTTDYSRDGIITLDDFNHCYYWRTITPYFSRRDMELDDWLTVKVPKGGAIELASAEIISSLHRGESLAFLGFMEGEKSGMEVELGRLKMWNPEKAGKENLIHNCDITHGYSGGPVIARHGHSFYAVGIVSKVDDRNQQLKMSVPATVVRGGRMMNDE